MSIRGKAPRLSVIVPTLGRSRWLVPCLEALRRDGGEEIEILLVAPAGASAGRAEELADRILRPPPNAGFTGANNLAFAAARGDYLATVNDDAVIAVGWCGALLEALERRPEAAAAQGLNLRLDDPATVDGGGLAWNRAWQAVQIGHGEPADTMPTEEVEIFGVSATAAVYRREALAAVGGPQLQAFDPRLFAYYEDVDLACRLRATGAGALLVPAARAHHAGSTSGSQLRWGGRDLLYGNRHLVLARLLGRSFWRHLPRIAGRDVADLWNATRRGDVRAAAGIVAGWARALRRLPGFAHRGRPAISPDGLRRFLVDAR